VLVSGANCQGLEKNTRRVGRLRWKESPGTVHSLIKAMASLRRREGAADTEEKQGVKKQNLKSGVSLSGGNPYNII